MIKPLLADQGEQINIEPNGKHHECHDEDFDIYKIPDISNERGVMRRLLTVSAVCLILMIAEVIGGYIANSLSIMTDAAHLFSDLSGFFFSIFAIWLSQKDATNHLTFGYHRAQVIGALASVVIIWGLTIFLVWKAVERLITQNFEIDGFVMLVTAIFALCANLLMGKILHSAGHGHSHGLSGELGAKKGECDHGHSHGGGHGHSDKKEHAHGDISLQQPPKKHAHAHGTHKKKTSDVTEGQNRTREQNISMQEVDPNVQASESLLIQPNINGEQAKEKKAKKGHGHSHGAKQDEEPRERNLSVVSEADNVNLRAAMIHIIGDTLQSIGVIIAAVIIYVWQSPEGSKNPNKIKLADPICTFVFAILVLFTTTHVVKDCLKILMEGTPAGLNLEEFENKLKSIPGVIEVHDLHVWELQVGKPSLSVHITSDDPSSILQKATEKCRKSGIYHSTIQVEDSGYSPSQKHSVVNRCAQNIHK